MTVATIDAIQTAITGALTAASPSLRSYDYLTDNFTAPCAVVTSDGVPEYHSVFGYHQAEHDFLVILIAPRASERSGLTAIEQMISNTTLASSPTYPSVRAVLEKDPTLGGVVETLKVVRANKLTAITINGAEYVSCVIDVKVWTG